ncbi:MAG: UPF0149 family protein [Rhodospirillales bacterium]|nr:UPF0149 family protein [Rhodospirillales bacterium]
MPSAPFEFDIDELDDFLMSDEAPEESMLISDLDGFLTGIVIGPELIMPSEWLPVVWGGVSPAFESEDEAGRILGLIMGRYNEIIHCLAEAPEELAPIFLETAKGTLLAADWAEGFMQAVQLRPLAWKELYEDEDACLLMAPILAWLAVDEDDAALEPGEKEGLELLRGDPDRFISEAVAGIDAFWKARRQSAPPVQRASPKTRSDYPEPVSRLLVYGEGQRGRQNDVWPDYLQLGLTSSHIPDLIRMASDPTLNHAGEGKAEVWAPLHAWRALGQLKAEKAVQPLLELLKDLSDDDWFCEDLPRVLALIGPGAIQAVADFLANTNIDPDDRISAPECLEKIAAAHPDHRDECIGVLVSELNKHQANGPSLNAWIVSALVGLHAVEAIELIRQAFKSNSVEFVVTGDLEDVEIRLGLRVSRDTPRPRYVQPLDLPYFDNLARADSFVPNVPYRREAKVGRNDPCPCGSGKKFKKCCGT